MKKILILSLWLGVASYASGGSNGVYSGPNYTTGNVANEYSIHIASKNPAAAALAVAEGNNFRINYLPTVWNTYELGEVDNFIDDLDELIDILDDPTNVDDSIETVLNRFNRVLVEMGESGYSKTNIGFTAPILPLYYHAEFLDATFFTDFSYGGTIGLSILDDELIYDAQNGKFATNTAAYLKSGIEARLSGGMSKKLYAFGNNNDIEVYGGFKFSWVNLELSKQIIALQQLNGESIEDVIEDSYDQNLETTSNIAIDMGVMLVAKNYRAGVTVTDINSPTYNYGAVGVQCDGFDDGSIARSNCYTAAYYVQVLGEIMSQEKHKRNALVTVDGVLNLSEQWALSGEMEMAAYDDVVGHQNQWMTLATTYRTTTHWLPDLRAGYRKNLAGSELSSINVGFTFWGRLTIDGAWGLESVEVDDVTVPRTFGFSVGLQQKF